MMHVSTRNGSRRGKIFAIAVSVVLLIGGSVTWALWPKDRQKLVAELGGDRDKIREAVDSGKITRDEARDAMRQRWEAEQTKRVNDFFALPPGKERDKYLDRVIDEMEARRRDWEQRRSTTQPTTRPMPDGPATRPTDAQRARGRAERGDRTPPDQRAKRAEFMSAMMKRMQQRGITPGRSGGGGWGGGGGGRGRGG